MIRKMINICSPRSKASLARRENKTAIAPNRKLKQSMFTIEQARQSLGLGTCCTIKYI